MGLFCAWRPDGQRCAKTTYGGPSKENAGYRLRNVVVSRSGTDVLAVQRGEAEMQKKKKKNGLVANQQNAKSPEQPTGVVVSCAKIKWANARAQAEGYSRAKQERNSAHKRHFVSPKHFPRRREQIAPFSTSPSVAGASPSLRQFTSCCYLHRSIPECSSAHNSVSICAPLSRA